MQTRKSSSRKALVLLFPINLFLLASAGMLVLTSAGCGNQQSVIDELTTKKVELEQKLIKAEHQASQLANENTAMQQGLETVKKAAQDAAQKTHDLVKQAQADATKAAKQAQVAGEQALASAKSQAAEELSKATVAAREEVAQAKQEAQKLVADLQKQLDEANAQIAKLKAESSGNSSQ